MAIYCNDGTLATSPNNRLTADHIDKIDGRGVVRCNIGRLTLMPDTYRVTVAIHSSAFPHAYDIHDQAYNFQVKAPDRSELGGVFLIDIDWSHSILENQL